jgi:hypothetical protein
MKLSQNFINLNKTTSNLPKNDLGFKINDKSVF